MVLQRPQNWSSFEYSKRNRSWRLSAGHWLWFSDQLVVRATKRVEVVHSLGKVRVYFFFKHIVCIICERHLLDNYDVCCFDLMYDQFWVCWVLFLYDDCNLGRAKKVKGWNVHEFCPLHQRKYKTAFYSFYLPVALAMLVTGVRDRAAYDTAREALLLETQSSYSTCPCVYHPYSVICVVCTSPEEKTDQHLPRGAK